MTREYTGHGVGREMHEGPQVPNYGRAGRGVLLRPGLTIALEPMSCAADAFNNREGLITLAPGEKFSARYGVKIL